MISFWILLILTQEISWSFSTILRDAVYNGATPQDKPLAELVSIVQFVQAKKSKELKEFLDKSACETKIQYIYYVQYKDAYDPFGLEYHSVESLFLVSMYGCPPAMVYAARMRILLDSLYAERVRDVTEVMVTVSETAKLHDDFQNAYSSPTRNDAKPNLKWALEETRQLKDTDTKNVCLELKDRKRADPGPSAIVDVPAAAQTLKNEMDDWNDKRNRLDAIMMQDSFDQLILVFEEFKKINDGKSLVDTFSEKFQDNGDKLTVYKQLVAIASDKIAYFADELQARLVDNIADSLAIAYTIVFMGALSKEDRDKVKVEYKKKFNSELIDQLEETLNKSQMEVLISDLMKSYIDDLKQS